MNNSYVASATSNIEWAIDSDDQLAAFVTDAATGHKQRCAWAPQEGSQRAFLLSTSIFEVLYEGNRGGGKTDALIANFGQFIGRGYGKNYSGLLLRQTYPELRDVMRKCDQLIPAIWPQAKYNKNEHTWTWPTGEQLILSFAKNEDDYRHHHGHNHSVLMFEELTTWPTPDVYLMFQSLCRSPIKGMPLMYRSTTNPYGPGHAWVKKRFRLPIEKGEIVGPIITDSVGIDGEIELPRVAIHGHFDENLVLKRANPDYFKKLKPRNPAQLAAWKHGDWTVTAGGMVDDVWDPDVHVVRNFKIPASWRIDRGFDWGSSKPFSVLWFARSDGSSIRFDNGEEMRTVRGDVFIVREWYGTNGQPNEGLRWLPGDISQGIVEREVKWGWRRAGTKRADCIVKDGPADTAIFNVEAGHCIADEMEERVQFPSPRHPLHGQEFRGITWEPADKRPGSRKIGWEALRQALKNALPYTEEEGEKHPRRREEPGLFVIGEQCPFWVENVPNLPRDKKDPDDVDTDAEDHDADVTRYRVRQMGTQESHGQQIGM